MATGKLAIVESDITVPTKIPHQIPDLNIIYKNASAPPPSCEIASSSYPLHLNLDVAARDGIFISGRGLDSEWRGNFHVGGTQTEVDAAGRMELIKGTFQLAGKAFQLTQGTLTLNGNNAPTIDLAATIQVKEVLITAHLAGPLNNPQVTLNSSPPLPMGTILAYLLFGQDLAEISSTQALQLAASLSSLAGDTPGILERTQKKLGLDRLEFVEVKSATEHGKMVQGIQIGKYVADGVLVSYSQGAENSAGNIRVEVEVRGNISLVLESDQADEQKQGKFTLRWSRTY
jgi:translocation and assembly module TamB